MKASWTLATATAVLLILTACSGGDDKAAFAAAKTAVAAKLPNEGADADFGELKLHHLTGLKGSKADVVCGGTLPKGAPNSSDPAPFIYIYKLQPVVPDPARTQGEVILLSAKVDRQTAGLLTNFCDAKLSTGLPNPYTYFN